jgi:hypothetical protein
MLLIPTFFLGIDPFSNIPAARSCHSDVSTAPAPQPLSSTPTSPPLPRPPPPALRLPQDSGSRRPQHRLPSHRWPRRRSLLPSPSCIPMAGTPPVHKIQLAGSRAPAVRRNSTEERRLLDYRGRGAGKHRREEALQFLVAT